MIKKSWLVLLAVITAGLWIGASPGYATGESLKITSLEYAGCNESDVGVRFDRSGFDGGSYLTHMQVRAGGRTYMNQGIDSTATGSELWAAFSDFSYGSVANQGTWPLPQNTPVEIIISSERPKGTVLTASKLVLSACNSETIRYLGPVADDRDDDLVPVIQDKCPSLTAFTETGCPTRSRSISLAAKSSPRRVKGRLSSTFPALAVGRPVTIWKVRPGPDLKLRTVITDSRGAFATRVKKGRYFATSAALIVPSAGQVGQNTSGVVRVR